MQVSFTNATSAAIYVSALQISLDADGTIVTIFA